MQVVFRKLRSRLECMLTVSLHAQWVRRWIEGHFVLAKYRRMSPLGISYEPRSFRDLLPTSR